MGSRSESSLARPTAVAIAALGIAAATAAGPGRRLDRRLFARLNGDLQHSVLDVVFRGTTELGSLWASIGAAAAIHAGGRRREAADALGAAIATWAVGQGLKRAFRRLRPYDADLPTPLRLLIAKPSGTSWPSSHPAVLLAFVTVAARDLRLGAAGRRALASLAGLVGVSRTYLGVHYPSDVAGGLLVGRAVADAWSHLVSPRVVGSRQPLR